MKKVFPLLAVLTLFVSCSETTVQKADGPDTSDVSLYANDYSRPLVDVMEDVAQSFGVNIITEDIPSYLTVDFADFRIRPYSLEETLEALTKTAGCKFRYSEKKGAYLIERDRYQKRTAEEGAKLMEYFASLYSDKEAWEARRDTLRRDILINSGVGRLPEHFDGAIILGDKRQYDGYYVQNLGIEILPGVYTNATIYHPTEFVKGGCPVVINPHGHMQDGRCNPHVQTRCAMEARMGCVAISYDMFAWGVQPLFDKKYHRTGLSQPVQIISGMRLLDYALALEEADPSRVCVTGCSGGGSQTMFIGALDDRVTICVPVVMMSSYFIGGCPCESGTRIHLSGGHTNNVEIASMFAPKPMLVISDGADWTKNVPEIGYPFLRRTYGFYGAEDKVFNVHLPEDRHDYGPNKRQAMYRFLTEQFAIDTTGFLDENGLFDESKCVVEDYDVLKVWGMEGEYVPKNAIRDIAELAAVLQFEKNR